MSSAGHILDSINRMKYNRSLKQLKRNRIMKLREELMRERAHLEIKQKQISESDLQRVKAEIRTKLLKRQKQAFWWSISISIALFSFLILLIRYLFF